MKKYDRNSIWYSLGLGAGARKTSIVVKVVILLKRGDEMKVSHEPIDVRQPIVNNPPHAARAARISSCQRYVWRRY